MVKGSIGAIGARSPKPETPKPQSPQHKSPKALKNAWGLRDSSTRPSKVPPESPRGEHGCGAQVFKVLYYDYYDDDDYYTILLLWRVMGLSK